MAWDPLGHETYSGDAPMDAFGEGLEAASIAWEREHGRMPTFTELAACFRDAAASARAQIEDPDEVPRLLARWLAGPSGARPSERRVAVRRGDVFRVPYTREKSVYGLVLFVESAREPRPGPGIGTLVAICDRDVADGEDPSVAAEAAWLFVPLHTYEALVDGRWPIVGRVVVDDARLPRLRRNRVYRDGVRVEITDYFGEPVVASETDVFAEHDGVSAVAVVRGIRAARGLGRFLPTPGLHPPIWKRIG